MPRVTPSLVLCPWFSSRSPRKLVGSRLNSFHRVGSRIPRKLTQTFPFSQRVFRLGPESEFAIVSTRRARNPSRPMFQRRAANFPRRSTPLSIVEMLSFSRAPAFSLSRDALNPRPGQIFREHADARETRVPGPPAAFPMLEISQTLSRKIANRADANSRRQVRFQYRRITVDTREKGADVWRRDTFGEFSRK